MCRDPLHGFSGGYGDSRGLAIVEVLEKPMCIRRA